MSTSRTRSSELSGPTERPGRPDGDGDDYSPAFAAWALLLTLVVLAALVVALWAMRGL
jgi:hypothetical protein